MTTSIVALDTFQKARYQYMEISDLGTSCAEQRGLERRGVRDPPCICQTFRGAILLVLSMRCFLSSFNCSFSSGYMVLR